MTAMTRDEILAEIRRTASQNGGRPLGRARFLTATGITEYELGKFWARFGDAIREAGLEPNSLNASYDEQFLLESFVDLTLRLGHIPTGAEMRLERSKNPAFPSRNVFARFGTKNQLIGSALEYCRVRSSHSDALPILESAYQPSQAADALPPLSERLTYGFVYLARGHTGEYKIGRTNLVDRRLTELGATSSVEPVLVHEIKTDDPVGVEAYWHSRFIEKRMRGEWFRLTSADVKAFKRWKRIY